MLLTTTSRYVQTTVSIDHMHIFLESEQNGTGSSPIKLLSLKSTTIALWLPAPKLKGKISTSVMTKYFDVHTPSIFFLPLNQDAGQGY